MTSFTLCLNTSTIRPQPLLEKIRLTHEAGFAAIELWANDIYEYVGRGGEVRDVERALADTGLKVPSLISVRGWGEAIPEEYPIVLDEVKRRFELATRLGMTWVVCSPPRQPCDVNQIVARYRDLLQLGTQIGVRPTFEYISFFRSISSLPQAWQVVQATCDPRATVIVDAFHSYNSRSTLDDLRSVPGDRISHYHIDDAAPDKPAGQQTDPDRVMPGDGPIDLLAELRVLRDIGYRGAISLELFHPQLWQEKPQDVLRRGYERLQALLEAL